MHSQVQIAVATNNFEMARASIVKRRKIQEAVVLLQRNHIGVNDTDEAEEHLDGITDAHLNDALRALNDVDGYRTTQEKINQIAKIIGKQPFHF